MKKSAIVILINSEDKILLQLRDNKPEILSPNNWGLIGGSVEENESYLEAIKREINEEINCMIDPIKELGKIYFKKEDIIAAVFLAKIDKKIEEIKLSEGQEVRFFYLKDIPNLKMPDLLKKFINENKECILSI